ncbi:hypothetical protein OAD49_02925, partial [Flavobacteriaceae bacterium]|nr:hypothetical protein [Flavobacteriaceae bacterium]
MQYTNNKPENTTSTVVLKFTCYYFFVLLLTAPTLWAQRTKVIDNKGTIKTLGNTVTTAATAPTSPTPIQGDIWYDTSLTSGAYTKIWDGTAWKIIDTYLGYKTIHHDATGALAITNTSHNLTDLHIESTGDLTIDKANVSDGTSLYITNTTATDRSLTFTNFSGAYLRNGGVIADISGTGLTVKANTRYLVHITDNAGSFYFNATEAGGSDSYNPLWQSNTNGGSYSTNDIINHNGVLYKNLTGANTATTPNTDNTNWVALGGTSATGAVEYSTGTWIGTTLSSGEEMTTTAVDGTIVKTGNQFLLRAGKVYELIASAEATQPDGYFLYGWRTASNVVIGRHAEVLAITDTYNESSNQVAFAIYAPTVDTYVSIDIVTSTNTTQSVSGQYTIKELASGGGTGLAVYNATESYNTLDTVVKDSKIYQANAAIPANTAFAIGTTGATWKEVSQADLLIWVNNTNGGSYSANDLVIYNGVIYKNLTGTNLDTLPDADFANWKATGGGDIVPLWKSDTNGGSYSIDDIINYNGVLYKNLTAANLDTLPSADTVNWEVVAGGVSQAGNPNYLQAEITTTGVTQGSTLAFSVNESRGLAHTTNAISLKQGTTYLLRGAVSGYFNSTTGNELRLQWEDANGVKIGELSRQMPGSSY